MLPWLDQQYSDQHLNESLLDAAAQSAALSLLNSVLGYMNEMARFL